MKLLEALLLGIFTGIINVLQTSLIQIITPCGLIMFLVKDIRQFEIPSEEIGRVAPSHNS
ncbi:hypothetical protein [Paenibacillus sp. NPDC055715]